MSLVFGHRAVLTEEHPSDNINDEVRKWALKRGRAWGCGAGGIPCEGCSVRSESRLGPRVISALNR